MTGVPPSLPSARPNARSGSARIFVPTVILAVAGATVSFQTPLECEEPSATNSELEDASKASWKGATGPACVAAHQTPSWTTAWVTGSTRQTPSSESLTQIVPAESRVTPAGSVRLAPDGTIVDVSARAAGAMTAPLSASAATRAVLNRPRPSPRTFGMVTIVDRASGGEHEQSPPVGVRYLARLCRQFLRGVECLRPSDAPCRKTLRRPARPATARWTHVRARAPHAARGARG